MDIAGFNLDQFLGTASPIIGILIVIIGGLLMIGIPIFMIVLARSKNWLIFPWEYTWKMLVWRPTGDTVFPTIDKGASIKDGNQKKIQLQNGKFSIDFPERKYILPFNWVEGFSAGVGHFVPIQRSFTGYNGEVSQEMLAEITKVQQQLEEEKDTKKLAELELLMEDTKKQAEKEVGGIKWAYMPSLDANSQNTMLREGEKINRQFPRDNDLITQLIIIGAVVLCVVLTIMVLAKMVGDFNENQKADIDARKAMATAMVMQNEIINASMNGRLIRPINAPNITGGGG